MTERIYTSLQTREIFHLEFLRSLSRKIDPGRYVLKGGVNLRLFSQSIRYSEDIDIDIQGLRVERVKKIVMEILSARAFLDSLKSFGIQKVIAPDIQKAKQTQTTQRFKIHLLTTEGTDLFTKIDFSRRGVKGTAIVEPVSAQILRQYKMAPLLVSHYESASAVEQKIQALAQRSVLQARDVFDLFVLSSQYSGLYLNIDKVLLEKAHDHIFLIEFSQFRDTVVAYLESEDQKIYSQSGVWDEIKLKTAHFLEEFRK